MLRIISIVSPPTTIIGLEGKLLGPWVIEVRDSVKAAQALGSVCLQLKQLQFADEHGLNLLRSLQRSNVELRDVPPLIGALLHSGPVTDET